MTQTTDGAAAEPQVVSHAGDPSRILMVTQHLLGIGHLVRSLRIASALQTAGADVTVIIGGVPVPALVPPNLAVVELPPLSAGPAGFKALVTATGEPADADYMAARSRRLFETFHAVRPDVLVIEAYPFARRMLAREMLPLLERAHARTKRPLIVSSVRDILQVNPDARRRRETVDIVCRLFDLVLVHGDPTFASLDETFPEADRIADRTRYTGFVAPPAPTSHDGSSRSGVIVTVGGGAVGAALIEAAIAAKPLSALANARWQIVTGPRMAPEPARRIACLARQGACEMTPFIADMPAALAQAQLAISQAGYNTVTDLLVASCPAVLVPFAEGGETEQAERARRLDARGLAVGLAPDMAVSGEAIATAIGRALSLPSRSAHGLMLEGARQSAELIMSRIHT